MNKVHSMFAATLCLLLMSGCGGKIDESAPILTPIEPERKAALFPYECEPLKAGPFDSLVTAVETHDNSNLVQVAEVNYEEGFIDFALLDRTTDALDDAPKYPDELAVLNGSYVEMIGFMAPYDSIEEFRRFMIVNFPAGCNFCSVPRLQEIVWAEIAEEITPPDFIEGMMRVRGVLKLKCPDSYHGIEGWLDDHEHDVFSEFIFVIADATAEEVKAE